MTTQTQPPAAIPHGTVLLVADDKKALVLRNEGGPGRVDLRIEDRLQSNGPPPVQDRARNTGEVSEKRSGGQEADWHAMPQDRFARDLVAALDRLATAGRLEHLVLVAAPKLLAELREALSQPLQRVVIAEMPRDLTNHPVEEIGRVLTKAA